MQKVSLPPLRSGIQVSSVAQREPPGRSWTRYKKLLIDNPRDSNLLQRQKLWNFQKLNRGAFRSHLVSLPDIPYRVHTNTVEKVSVAVQVDEEPRRVSTGLRIIFPNLANRRPSIFSGSADSDDNNGDNDSDSSTRHKACSPMGTDHLDYPDDFEEDSSVDDPGFEFDTVLQKKNACTMTEESQKKRERKRKSVRVRTREKASILLTQGGNGGGVKKAVKFREVETADAASQTPEIPINTPTPLVDEYVQQVGYDSATVEKLDLSTLNETPSDNQTDIVSTSRRELSTMSTDYVKVPVARVGHSSQAMHDPLSVLDILSGGLTDRTRNSHRKRPPHKNNHAYSPDPEADRVWFEKIVGDREVIDTATYESFARTRPNISESTSDSNTDKYTDYSRTNTAKKNFTPRIYDEFPQYHSLLAKDKKSWNTTPQNKAKPSRRTMVNIGKMY